MLQCKGFLSMGVRVALVISALWLAGCQSVHQAGSGAKAAAPAVKTGSFTTSDGVKLHYLEAGSGKPLVMIPGWSQTAAQFKHQLSGLSSKYRVIAIDMRGHGESDKPEHGYRIHRLSRDVNEFLAGKGLKDVTLAGHSMGCSVIWGYWELFGPERVTKLVLIDQMPMITANPVWGDQEKTDAGAVLDKNSLYDITNALAGPEGVKTTEGFISGMFTKQFPRDELNWVIEQNLKMPLPYAARLLYDHATNDWRDTIRRINVPTLVVGGKTSLVGWKSQQWIGAQIPGARTVIFEEAEGGNHFMFMENPAKFNQLVAELMNRYRGILRRGRGVKAGRVCVGEAFRRASGQAIAVGEPPGSTCFSSSILRSRIHSASLRSRFPPKFSLSSV